MSLRHYHQNIDHFVGRIKEVLQLEEDIHHFIPHRQNIVIWIQQLSNQLKEEKKEKERKGQGFLNELLNFTGLSSNKKTNSIEANLQRIKQIMSQHIIDFQEKEIQEMQIPKEIFNSLKYLNKKIMPNYYAVVSCPLFKSLFLKKRQSFDRCVQKSIISDLRVMNLGFQGDNLNVVKYQRNSLEQLFQTFCTDNRQYSVVIKLEVQNKNLQKNYIESFCYIEDLLCKKQMRYKTLQEIVVDEQGNKNLYIQVDKQRLEVDEMSLFHAFISQMIILPIQTFAADYVVQISDQGKGRKDAKIVKCRKSLQTKELERYLKDHSSLRNPLFNFNKFIKFHQYSNKQLMKSLDLKTYYSNFYEMLNILVKYLVNDFNLRTTNNKINSLAFDESIFEILWKVVHQLVHIPNWISQIINPIKEGFTLYEINNKICPIFNEIIKCQKFSYQEFKNNILALPIQNYLTLNVSKITIQKYKDMYVTINSVLYINYQSKREIFQKIFYKTVKNYDITIVSIYEALHFLNFISKNYIQIYETQNIHFSWKNKKIWSQIIQIKNKEYQQLYFIGIELQIIGLYLGVDVIQNSSYAFESIINNDQNDQLFYLLQILIKALTLKFDKKMNTYLSILIEKSFINQKYKICQFLINKGIHIHNYEYLFQQNDKKLSKLSKINDKKRIILLMKNKEPQMFRKYQWQELIHYKLKDKMDQDDLVVLNTINKGQFRIKKSIYDNLQSRNLMNSTISRKDYMFCNNRLIAKLNTKDTTAYVEITQYPLLRYFYMFFLEKLEKNSLALNFCGFFVDNGTLVHLIECIPQCFNFQKGISSYTELQLKNFTKEDQISQAIIISMILMPTNILLKNIIISPEKPDIEKGQEKKNLFIIDFNDFYQKNGFESKNGEIMLKVKNSLFLFEEMKSPVSQKLMMKYASLDVLEIINAVTKQSIEFINQVNDLKIKPKQIDYDSPQQEKQIFSLIFQKGFLCKLTERMFKIKNIFEKYAKNKTNLSHLQLLQKLNPSLSYYYQEIINTTPKLIERQQILLDENYKKSFLINTKFINFVGMSYNIEQIRDIFPNHYGRFNFQGPSQNLTHLYDNILKYDVYTKKITELRDYNHDVIEYLIRNIDLSTYQKEEKEVLMLKMQKYSEEYLHRQNKSLPLSVVRVNNIQNVREKSFKYMNQRLQEIIFEDVRSTESQLNSILKKYNTINNLHLINASGVQKIGELMINISDNLVMKNLRYLSIVGCPDIVSVDLASDQLQHVTFRKNKSLSEIYIFSKKLKNMDCSQCPKLRLQNIGIYIFKNINVLLCQNSCDGDIKRLEDKDYSVFLTRILRYLFNRFEESNIYKLQLVITLVKLQLIDDKLFGFKNQAINKSLVNLVAKLGTEIINMVETQIFYIFIHNNQLDLFNLNELLKIQNSSLKVLQNYLLKQISQSHKKSPDVKKKLFKSLNFKDFINIPQYYNHHLSFIQTSINYISVDKTFKFIFSISKDIQLQKYIQYINILNRKQNLERLQLIIHDSQITDELIQFIFSLDHHEKNAIGLIEFHHCSVEVKNMVQIANQPMVKSIVFNNCQINNITFVKFFVNLHFLELNNCRIDKISSFYQIMGDLKQLNTLSLIKLRQNIKENNMQLNLLFDNLKKMPKLQTLNFSQNKMDYIQVCLFAQELYHLKIKELNLFEFYNENEDETIQYFMRNPYIKWLNIQFKVKNEKIIHSFIDSLAKNDSIIKLYLKTDHQIESIVFEKLKGNKRLQCISSNQNIPNWLKNHIASNTRSRSTFEYDSMKEEISFGSKNEDFFRIGLSLDGGGVKGMLLASELHYLSTKVGKPLHKIFDCIGGTSIGGILALGSTASLDGFNSICSTSDLVDIFQMYSTKIFKKSQFGTIANILQTKYDVRSFQDLLIGYFKQSKLSDVLSSTNVIVTAVNRLSNEDVIFRSINAIFDRNLDFYMKDIARATSAAPTYFPSAEIKNIQATQKYSLIDGGVGLNNPSKLVIDDLIKITQNESHKKNYFLLSLGTGRIKNDGIPSHAGIKDLAPIIDCFTQSANYFIEKDLSQHYKGHYLRLSPLVNLKKSDGQLDNTNPDILQVYKETGFNAAEEFFSNTISFGKYKNQSLVQWLQENTDRKYEI